MGGYKGETVTVSPGVFVIQSSPVPLYLEPGHELRGAPCILCGKCIGGELFVIVTISNMTRCMCGRPELPGVITMRHLGCTEPDDKAFVDIVTARMR